LFSFANKYFFVSDTRQPIVTWTFPLFGVATSLRTPLSPTHLTFLSVAAASNQSRAENPSEERRRLAVILDTDRESEPIVFMCELPPGPCSFGNFKCVFNIAEYYCTDFFYSILSAHSVPFAVKTPFSVIITIVLIVITN
jgi:hypothetical protein